MASTRIGVYVNREGAKGTFTVGKFWPNGVTYAECSDAELRDVADKEKKNLLKIVAVGTKECAEHVEREKRDAMARAELQNSLTKRIGDLPEGIGPRGGATSGVTPSTTALPAGAAEPPKAEGLTAADVERYREAFEAKAADLDKRAQRIEEAHDDLDKRSEDVRKKEAELADREAKLLERETAPAPAKPPEAPKADAKTETTKPAAPAQGGGKK